MSNGESLAARVDNRNTSEALRLSAKNNDLLEDGNGPENDDNVEDNQEIPNRFNLSVVNCGPPRQRSESLVDPSTDNQPSGIGGNAELATGNQRSARKRQRTGLESPDIQQRIDAAINKQLAVSIPFPPFSFPFLPSLSHRLP